MMDNATFRANMENAVNAANASICDDERKAVRFFTKALKIAIGVCIVSGLFLVFVPSKETLIEMMVAKQATYENATWTVDALKSAVDYVVQAIQSLK